MGLADLLYWFDQTPSLYWWTVSLCLAATLVLCLVTLLRVPGNPRAKKWLRVLNHDAWFCLAIASVIFAGRWPIIAFPRPINPDEAAFITAAITLWHDPVFWRSICVGTSGPFTSYLLLLPRLFGCPFGYASARVVGLLATVGIISFLYLAARQIVRRPLARIAVVPTSVFFSLTVYGDFVHYGGELCPLLILSADLFCLAKLWKSRRQNPWLIFVTGLLAGAVPFAKLQGAPLAMVIGGTALLILARRPSRLAERLRSCVLIIAGGISPLLAALIMTGVTGCTEIFLNSYFLANLSYAGQGLSLGQSIYSFPEFFSHGELLRVCLACEVVLGILILVAVATISIPRRAFPKVSRQHEGIDLGRWWKRFVSSKRMKFLAFVLVIFAATFYSVLAPGRHFPHYLLFLIVPGLLWLIACLSYFDRRLKGVKLPTQRLATCFLLIPAAILILAPQAWAVHKTPRPIGHMKQFLGSPIPPPVIAVRKLAMPGRPLAVWGWMGEMFVDTGMWTATRDTVLGYSCYATERPGEQTIPDYKKVVPLFFQDLFMADLRRSDPAIFVDAVCPYCFAFHDRQRYGYETFPALAEYIDAHYRIAEEVDGVRIFVKKEDTRQ